MSNHSHIEVPTTFQIGSNDFAVINYAASKLNIDGRDVLLVAPNLVSAWGDVMASSSLNRGFMHGMFHRRKNPALFDVPALIDARQANFNRRYTIAQELGIDPRSDEVIQFDIDDAVINGIRTAATFFDRTPRQVIGVAISLVFEILRQQKNDWQYQISPDGSKWGVYPIDTLS